MSMTDFAQDAKPVDEGKRRFWAVILVLDTVLLFVFGGALAGLVYIQMASPPEAVVVARPRPKVPKAPPPGEKKEEQAEAAKTDAKPEEKKEAKPEENNKEGNLPQARPSTIAPSLPHRSTEPIGSKESKALPKAEPKAAASGDAEAPKAEPKAQAKPIPSGQRAKLVEFSHKAPDAKEVFLKGPFLVRTGGRKEMAKSGDGTWTLSISLLPGLYKYSFIVDGKRTAIESVNVE